MKAVPGTGLKRYAVVGRNPRDTYNACASIRWDEGLSFPVQSGHPCLGCSEPDFWDGGGFYQGQSAPLERPAVAAVGAAVAAGAAIGVGNALVNQAKKKAKEGAK